MFFQTQGNNDFHPWYHVTVEQVRFKVAYAQAKQSVPMLTFGKHVYKNPQILSTKVLLRKSKWNMNVYERNFLHIIWRVYKMCEIGSQSVYTCKNN